MSFKRTTVCAAILAAIQATSYGQGVNTTITTSGSANPLSFNATISIPQSYVGNNSKLWMAILQGDQAYFLNGNTGFVPYTGGLAALLSNSRTEPPSVRSITNTTETISLMGDARGVMGGQVYIGYGATFGELINNARYKNIYNVSVPVAVTSSNYSSNVVNQIMQVPIIFPVATPGGAILSAAGHFGRYMNFGMNGGTHGDLRGTGMDDIIVTPNSSPAFLPFSKMEFWINNGDGTFTNKADQLIVGGAPTWAPGPTIVADFNGDGIKDILHMNSQEMGPCSADNQSLCTSGGQFTYLKGQPNGTWVDQSSFPATVNTDSVVMVSSSNSDGVQDILFGSHGLHFYKNDGTGKFTDQSYRFPLEIRGFNSGQAQCVATACVAQSSFGAASFFKVVGQAKPALVSASYGYDWGTQPAGVTPGMGGYQTIRFFTQKADGMFVNAQTIAMSPALSAKCGASQVKVGDFTRTGTDDILVVWEQVYGQTNVGDSIICHPMLFRNIGGNGQINYVEVTDAAIPQWQSVFSYPTTFGVYYSPNEFSIVDVDGNGTLDIAIGGSRWSSSTLIQATPFLYNDGNGSFSTRSIRINGVTPTSDVMAALMDENVQMTWGNTVVPLRLKPNQPYGMLFIESGRVGDQTTMPYIVDKQIRLHSLFSQ